MQLYRPSSTRLLHACSGLSASEEVRGLAVAGRADEKAAPTADGDVTDCGGTAATLAALRMLVASAPAARGLGNTAISLGTVLLLLLSVVETLVGELATLA